MFPHRVLHTTTVSHLTYCAGALLKECEKYRSMKEELHHKHRPATRLSTRRPDMTARPDWVWQWGLSELATKFLQNAKLRKIWGCVVGLVTGSLCGKNKAKLGGGIILILYITTAQQLQRWATVWPQ